ncbi:MAG: 50S ribosomal protein L4 [Nitrospirales bacterium]|nr:50S ribosomal protein L4 [Nitrospira sp.]MDR4500389.1 50S ribosomal protein L4 [Nitrospirales bacterium]
MPTAQIRDISGNPRGNVDLSEKVFGVEVDRSLLHSAVVMQRASRRQGTSSTLGRGEVKGSGRKPWKQKHTGRARAGSVRSPIWRHGGIVFGPKPRSYEFRLPKKMYRSALRSALSAKAHSGDVVLIEDLSMPEQKTRHFAKLLSDFGFSGNLLVVAGDGFDGLERVARNIPNVKLARVEHLNVYDILRCQTLVILQAELENIQEYWS